MPLPEESQGCGLCVRCPSEGPQQQWGYLGEGVRSDQSSFPITDKLNCKIINSLKLRNGKQLRVCVVRFLASFRVRSPRSHHPGLQCHHLQHQSLNPPAAALGLPQVSFHSSSHRLWDLGVITPVYTWRNWGINCLAKSRWARIWMLNMLLFHRLVTQNQPEYH